MHLQTYSLVTIAKLSPNILIVYTADSLIYIIQLFRHIRTLTPTDLYLRNHACHGPQLIYSQLFVFSDS